MIICTDGLANKGVGNLDGELISLKFLVVLYPHSFLILQVWRHRRKERLHRRSTKTWAPWPTTRSKFDRQFWPAQLLAHLPGMENNNNTGLGLVENLNSVTRVYSNACELFVQHWKKWFALNPCNKIMPVLQNEVCGVED